MIYRFFVCILFALVLLGCEKPAQTYEYFISHPSQIEAVYKRCKMLAPTEASATPECITALKAAQTIRDLFLQLAANQDQYGLRILTEQMKVAKLEEQLASSTSDTEKNNLAEQLKQQQLIVMSMISVIRFVTQK